MGNAMYRKQATNKEYQSWTGYPDSPVLTYEYPNQCIANNLYLFCGIRSVSEPYVLPNYHILQYGVNHYIGNYFNVRVYGLVDGGWVLLNSGVSAVYYDVLNEANSDIYTDTNYNVVYFSKTTSPSQDPGTTTSLIRIRNLHHKDGASLIRNKAAFWKQVTNNVGYQKWTGYPESPELTSVYSYQVITPITGASVVFLTLAKGKLYVDGSYAINYVGFHTWTRYRLTGGAWITEASDYTNPIYAYNPREISQSNYDIYTDVTLSSVYFAKTTTPSQDAGISETLHRINI